MRSRKRAECAITQPWLLPDIDTKISRIHAAADDAARWATEYLPAWHRRPGLHIYRTPELQSASAAFSAAARAMRDLEEKGASRS